jgi:uncharacterized protein YcfJ
MISKFKKILVGILAGSLIISACAMPPETTNKVGSAAALGAVLGGTAGALVGEHNKWKSGVIGAAIGAAALGGLAAIDTMTKRTENQAIVQNRPVVYRSSDGATAVRVDPIGVNQHTKCHKVRTRVWEHGKLVKDEIKEVCEGERIDNSY